MSKLHEIQDLKISPEHETLSIPSNSFEMKMIPMNEQDMQGLSIQDQELIPENNSNDPESFSVDTTDTTSNIFSDLCDTYMWSYDFETQICTLQYGTECSEYDEDTIFQCYSRDNTLSR